MTGESPKRRQGSQAKTKGLPTDGDLFLARYEGVCRMAAVALVVVNVEINTATIRLNMPECHDLAALAAFGRFRAFGFHLVRRKWTVAYCRISAKREKATIKDAARSKPPRTSKGAPHPIQVDQSIRGELSGSQTMGNVELRSW
jgi:hypothetical protein